MTPVTLRAETALVLVILLMATDTRRGRLYLLIHTLAMAGIAIQPLMAAIQFEAGPSIVIKIPELPIPDAVAVLTLCA